MLGRLGGTITAITSRQRERRTGDRLFDVNLGPVVVAQGRAPAFRAMQRGLNGQDVRQLQEMLRALGLRTLEATGSFDAATQAQVRAWQRRLAVPMSGEVALGGVLFVPKLPAVIQLAPSVVVGGAAPQGDQAAIVRPASPSFAVVLPAGQAALAEVDQEVSLEYADHRWLARIGALSAPADDGSVVASLRPATGDRSICQDQCESISGDGVGGLRASITVVPPRDGLVVPTAAMRVRPDGTTEVVSEDGKSLKVTVVAAAGGTAVVEGVALGTRIRVPAT